MPCPICDDTGWKPVEIGGVARVTRCACMLDKAARARLGKANIPSRYQHCTFDNFTAYNDTLKRAVEYARRAVADFPARSTERDRGLLLIGPPGVGKTHLAVAMLKECIHRGGIGAFYTTITLMAVLRSTYSGDRGETESDVLRAVTDADIVVLDDLGRERSTDWRDEMLHLIVNARYSGRRLTVFTTNFDVGDMEDLDSLQVRVGLRVYSRLQEMCELIHIDAGDYRERPLNAGVDDLITLWKTRKKAAAALPSPRGTNRQARAQLRMREGNAELKWPGGKAGS